MQITLFVLLIHVEVILVVFSLFQLFTPVKTRYLYCAFRMLRLAIWAAVLHISFYIYYRAFLLHPELINVKNEDDVAAVGCLYLNGIAFHLTYIVVFGLPNVLGDFDGMHVPHWPRCISHLYSYKELWK